MKLRAGFILTFLFGLALTPMSSFSQTIPPQENKFNTYRVAEPGVQVIDREGLTLNDFQMQILLESLVAAGVNYSGATHERRSKAVALALQVDPEHPSAVAANSLLSERKPRNKIDGYRVSDEISQVLYLAANRLQGGSEADLLLARYVLDIAWMCGSKDERIVTAFEKNREDGGPDWLGLFPPPPPPPSLVEEMKLEAEVFAATETKANALIYVKEEGSFTAKPTMMHVKAEREKPYQRRSWMIFQVGSENIYVSGSGPWRAMETQIPERGGEKWRSGYKITVTAAFDGPRLDRTAASVAGALAVDSLVTGAVYDEKFAVSGKLGALGKIARVGGIGHKLEGAAAAGLTHIALPAENRPEIIEYVGDNSIAPFVKVQVFTVENFDQTIGLALEESKRDFLLNQSIKEFNETMAMVTSMGGSRALAKEEVQLRFANILKNTPNHLSAEVLLKVGRGTAPKHRSILVSYNEIERFRGSVTTLMETELTKAEERLLLDMMRQKMRYHPKSYPALEALRKAFDASRMRSTATSKRNAWKEPLRAAIQQYRDQVHKLKNDPELQSMIQRMATEPLTSDGTER